MLSPPANNAQGKPIMNAPRAPSSTGSTQLHFSTSFGEPLESIAYRLRDERGTTHVGTTSADGRGVTVCSGHDSSSGEQAGTWWLPVSGHVQIDIRRDDGSWKHIGSFCHYAHQHSNVVIKANATAFPFKVDLA